MKNKGQKLDELLNESNKISRQMDSIFKRSGVKKLDLRKLSESDRQKWLKLHEIHSKLGEKMAAIIKS